MNSTYPMCSKIDLSSGADPMFQALIAQELRFGTADSPRLAALVLQTRLPQSNLEL